VTARRAQQSFFVYGTLRPGQHNFGRICPLVVETERATLLEHLKLVLGGMMRGPGGVICPGGAGRVQGRSRSGRAAKK